MVATIDQSVSAPELLVATTEGGGGSDNDLQVTGSASNIKDTPARDRVLSMGNRYAYREANWQIGRAAERANVQVKEFVPGDRWAAWRKSQARIRANEEKKRLRSSAKKGGKAKKDAKRGR
jgi:large subunit ribosomal protein L27